MDVAERAALVGSIVNRLSDYRSGEIDPVDSDRVLAWLNQFDACDRPTILRETNSLLLNTYVSKQIARTFIEKLAVNEKLVGDNPTKFWSNVSFLRIQKRGSSQRDMLALLGEVLKAKFGLELAVNARGKGVYVYLDDVSCSGSRIISDIEAWLQAEDIKAASVHLITIGSHYLGEYKFKSKLLPLFNKRECKLTSWSARRFENRLLRQPKRSASVLIRAPKALFFLKRGKHSASSQTWLRRSR